MRRAKIVCTLGPATSGFGQVLALVRAGMDVARLNMSHGTHEGHAAVFQNIRQASDQLGRKVGILADLQGPKIRLGEFDEAVELADGERFTITIEDVPGTAQRCSTTHKGLPGDVHVGDVVLLDDGKLTLRVVEVGDTDVVTQVVVGGTVSSNKGLNLPGADVSVPALSDKDTDDLRWALRQGVDLIALSFVRRAADLDDVHAVMDEAGIRVPVIAKIEKPQAVDNLEEIVEAFDAIMVARGDLGVELPLERVPLVQKRAVSLSREASKPVIVATQVLESMVTAPRPTRAEASDAANAILDGADALMLSGETSVGRYPVESVRTMSRIIEHTEKDGLERIETVKPSHTRDGAITMAAAQIASWVEAKYLVAFTQSGGSARRLARLRSAVPILAFTPDPAVCRRLALSWGVETFISPQVQHTDDMVFQVESMLLETGRCERGDFVVICAGSPLGIPGTTNAVRVHQIGDAQDVAARQW